MELPHTSDISVRYRDTDSQGPMYFANYLVFADEAMSLYWRKLGWSLEDMETAPCYTFAVNANVDFVSECLAFDVLTISVGFSRLGNSSADTAFEVRNQRTGELAAKGSFTHVFVDKTSRQSCPIPEALRSKIVEHQPELS